jgi:hypothetical protein
LGRQSVLAYYTELELGQGVEGLRADLQRLDIPFTEGGWTFYLPPSQARAQAFPGLAAAFDGAVGLKILKDLRGPMHAVYTPNAANPAPGAALLRKMTPSPIALTVADRFETMATAVAASYMNIALAHTQGGEVTGSIDESVRHAVTKLSHLHFPATAQASEYLVRMGEDPEMVHYTGCPSIDLIAKLDLTLPPDIFTRYQGVGGDLDPTKPYLVVLQHPVTTEYGRGFDQITQTLMAVERTGLQTAWLWPNVDAGSDDVSKGLRVYREAHAPGWLHLYRNFAAEDYARLISNAQCLVGRRISRGARREYREPPAGARARL